EPLAEVGQQRLLPLTQDVQHERPAVGEPVEHFAALADRGGYLRRIERALMHPTGEHPGIVGDVPGRQHEQPARDAAESRCLGLPHNRHVRAHRSKPPPGNGHRHGTWYWDGPAVGYADPPTTIWLPLDYWGQGARAPLFVSGALTPVVGPVRLARRPQARVGEGEPTGTVGPTGVRGQGATFWCWSRLARPTGAGRGGSAEPNRTLTRRTGRVRLRTRHPGRMVFPVCPFARETGGPGRPGAVRVSRFPGP